MQSNLGFWCRCGMEEFAMKEFSLVTCCGHLLCTVHAVFLPWHWPGATLFVWRRGVITCHKLYIHLRPNTISNRDDTLLQAISRRQTANQLGLLVFWQTFKILSFLCPTVPVISSHKRCTRAPGVFRWCKAVALAIAAERRLPQCPKKTSGVWHNRERINSHPETTKRSVTFTQTENVSKWEEYWHSCEVHCCFSTVSEDYSIWDKPFKIQSLFMLRSWILLCGERTFQNSSNFFACYYHSKSIVDVECEHVYPYVPSLRPGTDCSNHDSRSLVIQQL